MFTQATTMRTSTKHISRLSGRPIIGCNSLSPCGAGATRSRGKPVPASAEKLLLHADVSLAWGNSAEALGPCLAMMYSHQNV